MLIIIIVLITLIFFALALSAVFFATSRSGRRVELTTDPQIDPTSQTQEELFEDNDNVPSKTVFAIYGVDKGEALSDVIIVASFDKIKNTLNTISIPRDTFVKVSKENRDELKAKGKNLPSSGIKINAVHSLSGEYGNEYLTRQIEELLKIHIDYYFEVNLNSFAEIVDSIGGVEIDVPTNMHYSDPTQNLYINIKKGKQLLNGKTALGFVRFRQYVKGDIQRIEMQKMFLKSFIEKITKTETIISNLPEFVTIFINNVNTNMTIGDALNYAPYVKNITADKITSETLPGDDKTPYNCDELKTRTLVNRLFYDVVPEEETETQTQTYN